MDIRWQMILAYGINIIVLFIVLRWVLFKPVSKFLKAREERFNQRALTLDQKETDAEEMRKDYERQLAACREEAAAILAQARTQAEKRGEEIVELARQDAKELMRTAQLDIEAERKAARQEIKDEVAELAVDLAGKILRRNANEEDHQRIVRDFLSGNEV